MRTRHILIVIAVALVVAHSAPAQSPLDAGYVPRFQSGARMSYLENFHHTNSKIFCCTECGTFSDGTGSGYSGEVFAEMPVKFLPELSFTLALGFSQRGGNFGEATTDNLPVQDPNTGAYVPLVRDHAYTAGLMYGDLVPGVKYQPLTDIPIYVGAGISIDFPFSSAAKYTQSESIRSPQGVLYPETNTQSRVVGEGVINDVGMSFAARGSLGYRIALNPSLDLAPEVTYVYPLTNVESAFQWRVTSLGVGAAVRWHFVPDIPDTAKPTPPPALATAPTRKRGALISLALAAGTPPLHIVETTVTETFPILPYIFFDSASPVLPARILKLNREAASNFSEANLPHRSLGSYYSILNIVGSRLLQNPTAHLTINGTTDGQEIQPKSSARDLAIARALRVRDYLAETWGIALGRLTVTSTDAPSNPSSTAYPEGVAENRRVELTSDNDDILKPIVHERFREETSQPKVLPITLATNEPARSWQLTVAAHGTTLVTREGQGDPPATFTWRPEDGDIDGLAEKLTAATGHLDSLNLSLEVVSASGERAEAHTNLLASKTTNPFELSRLSLIVFDFDQASVSEQNRRMISRFVDRSLYPVSTSTIVGSTDNLGELAHNEKLSQDRAINVRDLVLRQKPDAKIIKTEGIGPSNLLYDNTLPEGRYYCRTVRMEVETPLEAVLPKP